MDILSHLNGFDYILITIIGFSILLGLMRGMLREFISLITWIIAILVPVFYSEKLAVVLGQHVKPAILSSILSFILLFFIVFIIGSLINYIVGSLLGKATGFFADRLLGALFGLGRGGMIAFFIVFVISHTALAKTDWYAHSVSAKQLKEPLAWINEHVVQPVSKNSGSKIKIVKKSAEQQLDTLIKKVAK